MCEIVNIMGVNKPLVEQLEEFLQLAKEGHIRSMGFVTQYSDNMAHTSFTIDPGFDIEMLIAHSMSLSQELSYLLTYGEEAEE